MSIPASTEGEESYCPALWAENCYYSEVRCKTCRARDYDNESLKLNYKSISSLLPIKDHPCYIALEADKKAQRYADRQSKKTNEASKRGRDLQRAGKKAEQKIVKSTPGAQFTKGSGAVCGDGDARVHLGNLKLNVEIKLRTNGKNELGPTRAEWDKAKTQGVSIFMVTSPSGDIVTMDRSLFNEILEEVAQLEERILSLEES